MEVSGTLDNKSLECATHKKGTVIMYNLARFLQQYGENVPTELQNSCVIPAYVKEVPSTHWFHDYMYTTVQLRVRFPSSVILSKRCYELMRCTDIGEYEDKDIVVEYSDDMVH